MELATRKTLALLIYLALEGGWHSREKLAAIFWPRRDTSGGRANLRNVLVHLRKPLRHERDVAHLLVERNALALNPDADFESDWHALQRTISVRDKAAMNVAIDEYRGDFLEGFTLGDAPEFDDWVTLRREQAHRQLETVFERLSRVQLDAGEIGATHTTVSRWLEHNPLSEEAYRRLMRLHLMQGDRAASRAAYEQCRAVLNRELGTEPDAETEHVRQRIENSHDLAHDADRPGATPARRASILKRLSTSPLVGRGAEFRQLTAAFQRSRPLVTVLRGQSGVGKTRLADEFCRWALGQGADVLRGRAFETGGRLPYQPVVHALRPRLEAENAPEDLLPDVWLTELSRLLPELRARYPDLPQPFADETFTRTRLFEAVSRLVHALARHSPVVFFLDDMQWADTATRDLLLYAVDRWTSENTPLLLLLAFRREALAGGRDSALALTKWLDALEHMATVQHLTLPPFSRSQTKELIEVLAGESPQAQAFARWLQQETRGQPFYIRETLEALHDQGWLKIDEGKDHLDLSAAFDDHNDIHADLRGYLPPGVHRLLRARLAALSQKAFILAAAGAVLGQYFSFQRTAQVARLDETAALSALDELLAHRIWNETEDEARPYTFAHDKIRDVTYTEAGAGRRRAFHRRALDLLQDTGAPAVEQAHHALRAGQTETALRQTIAAGDEALAVFAMQDAIAFYEQALQILSEADGVRLETDLHLHLYQQLGRAHDIVGELPAAEEAYSHMAMLARESEELAPQALAVIRLAAIKAYMHEPASALSLADEALDLAGRSGDPRAIAEANWNMAHLGLYGADVADMEAHGGQALELAREIDDAELIARCLNVLAYNARNHGQVEDGLSYAGEALKQYQDLGDRPLEADCLGLLGQLNLMAGQPRRAVSNARRALAISDEIESAHGRGFNSYVLALGLLDCGLLGEAGDVIEGMRDAGWADDGPHQFMVRLNRSLLHRACCDVSAALTIDRQLLGALEEDDGGAPLGLDKVVIQFLVEDHALLERWDAAAEHASEAPLPSPSVWLFLTAQFRWWLVIEALLHGNDDSRAQKLLDRIEELSTGFPRLRLAHARCRAVLARRRGLLEQAAEQLQAALALALDMDLPNDIWSIQGALARIAHERGDADAVRAHREAARETIDRLAARTDEPALRESFVTAATALRKFPQS